MGDSRQGDRRAGRLVELFRQPHFGIRSLFGFGHQVLLGESSRAFGIRNEPLNFLSRLLLSSLLLLIKRLKPIFYFRLVCKCFADCFSAFIQPRFDAGIEKFAEHKVDNSKTDNLGNYQDWIDAERFHSLLNNLQN